MIINRRAFFSLSVGSLVGVNWIKNQFIPKELLWQPSQAQLDFINDDSCRVLYGIPYHQSDASTGQWLGLSRK